MFDWNTVQQDIVSNAFYDALKALFCVLFLGLMHKKILNVSFFEIIDIKKLVKIGNSLLKKTVNYTNLVYKKVSELYISYSNALKKTFDVLILIALDFKKPIYVSVLDTNAFLKKSKTRENSLVF